MCSRLFVGLFVATKIPRRVYIIPSLYLVERSMLPHLSTDHYNVFITSIGHH